MTSLYELKELPYAKEYPSFFPSSHEQKNLVDIQGINSLTRPWFYVYHAHRKLATFTSLHEYEEDHAFFAFPLASYVTTSCSCVYLASTSLLNLSRNYIKTTTNAFRTLRTRRNSSLNSIH